jgi:glycosyltransferase involved in cell wall biosynthesis
MSKIRLVRITTVPESMEILLRGQLPYMQSNGFDTIMISSYSDKVPKLIEENKCSFYPITLTRKITPITDLLAIIRLRALLKKLKPDIVHTHTPKAGMVGMIASKLAGVPVRIHTVAGLPLMTKKGLMLMLLEMVEKITYSCATHVFPNSHKLSAFILKRKYCLPNKLTVIANGSTNGIDCEYFKNSLEVKQRAEKIRQHYKIDSKSFVYIFIGRIVKDKGIEELVKAFNIICENDMDVKLLIVGDFENELDPISIETGYEINNNSQIILVPFQQDIRPYLASSNVLVFPSHREGFPNVPMQAGSMELPSIVSDINGCNEIVEHRVNGILFPPGDIKSLAVAMSEVRQDSILYEQLKNNARKKISERYDQKIIWNSLLLKYKVLTKSMF